MKCQNSIPLDSKDIAQVKFKFSRNLEDCTVLNQYFKSVLPTFQLHVTALVTDINSCYYYKCI
jgi:hypothetical protein